ncbi:MAG: hypothetical protein RL701_7018 [Pseudomonadota bacterium]|jgi:hypothetical protein
MFVDRVALQLVPDYARITPDVVDAELSKLLYETNGLERALRAGYRAMEARQPCLATYVAHELSELPLPRLQALGYFLSVFVFRVFNDTFTTRLACVQLSDINRTLERLVADGELRSEWVRGTTYSEDAIAVSQPALMNRLRAEVDRVVNEEPDVAGDALDQFYESLLVMVLVLTHAVAPTSRAGTNSAGAGSSADAG